jgi:hypothetical protein
MAENDANAATIRDYLISLLALFWEDQEMFDAKRPFGDSGWASDLDKALIRAGHVNGTIDDDGDVTELDMDAVDELIAAAIQSLGAPRYVEVPLP